MEPINGFLSVHISEVDDPCGRTDGSVEPINGFLSIHIREVDDPCSRTDGSMEPINGFLSINIQKHVSRSFGGSSITDPTVQWGP